MQWSEEEFLKWVREHPAVQDLIERTKDQPPDSEAGSKRPLWNFLRTAAPRHKLKVLLRLTGLPKLHAALARNAGQSRGLLWDRGHSPASV